MHVCRFTRLAAPTIIVAQLAQWVLWSHSNDVSHASRASASRACGHQRYAFLQLPILLPRIMAQCAGWQTQTCRRPQLVPDSPAIFNARTACDMTLPFLNPELTTSTHCRARCWGRRPGRRSTR